MTAQCDLVWPGTASTPAARPIVVLDPADRAALTHGALAAHRPEAGIVTVHPTPGVTDTRILAHDLLLALGKNAARLGPGFGLAGEHAAWHAAAAWTAAQHIRRITVLRAHLFTPARWRALLQLQQTTGVNLLLLYHDARPGAALRALLADYDARITDDPGRVHEMVAPPSAQHPPAPGIDAGEAPAAGGCFPPVPRSAATRFRADALRTLTAEQFRAVDEQYRYALGAACRWIAGHQEYRAANPARRALDAALMPLYLAPRDTQAVADFLQAAYGRAAHRALLEGLLCLGREIPSPHGYPFALKDAAGLQLFLSALVADCATPDAALARVRGAQAGLLLHGVLLAVPEDLHACAGPGLTSIPLTAELTRTAVSGLPHPVHAAALALAVISGHPLDGLRGLPISAVHPHAAAVSLDGLYAIPTPLRPAVHAACLYRRLSGASEHQRLLTGDTDGSLSRAVADALRAHTPAPAPRPELAWRSWHARAQCWFVAEPLHGARWREPELGRVR